VTLNRKGKDPQKGKEGEMSQTLYAHMNKIKILKKGGKEVSSTKN
jgi:hypothetical protein